MEEEKKVSDITVGDMIKSAYRQPFADQILDEIKAVYDINKPLKENMDSINNILKSYDKAKTFEPEERYGTAVAIGTGIGIAA
jgi:hypothetical protein